MRSAKGEGPLVFRLFKSLLENNSAEMKSPLRYNRPSESNDSNDNDNNNGDNVTNN